MCELGVTNMIMGQGHHSVLDPLESKEVQEQFGRKMNQDVNGNTKLFRKELSKTNGGKVENPNRIEDGNGRLAPKEAEA